MPTVKLFNNRPVYILGKCGRSDEGRVGRDVKCRPVFMGPGDYTFVTSPDCLDPAPTGKELRFVKADVRDEHSIGKFEECRKLAVFVSPQGAHDVLMLDIISNLREQGYETAHIHSHSIKLECL